MLTGHRAELAAVLGALLHVVGRGQLPDRVAGRGRRGLAGEPDAPAKSNGIAVGAAVAQELLALRARLTHLQLDNAGEHDAEPTVTTADVGGLRWLAAASFYTAILLLYLGV